MFFFTLVSCNPVIPGLMFQLEHRNPMSIYTPGNRLTGLFEDVFAIQQPIAITDQHEIWIELIDIPHLTILIEVFSSNAVDVRDFTNPLTVHQLPVPRMPIGDQRSVRFYLNPSSIIQDLPPGGMNVQGFRVSILGPELEQPLSKESIVAFGLSSKSPQRQGITVTPQRISLQEGYSIIQTTIPGSNTQNPVQIWDLHFPVSDKSQDLVIDYEFFPSPERLTIVPNQQPILPEVEILFDPPSGIGTPTRKAMRLHPGQQEFPVMYASLGFTPQSIRIINSELGFQLVGSGLTTPIPSSAPWYTDHPIEQRLPIPKPIDLGSLLRYPQVNWRNPEFELFSWFLYPEILVFDFQNRQVQDRFLDRLAFYVEKAGFIGTLVPNERLAFMHGWNAHNYRGEGLSSFFNTAQAQNFSLNPEELFLRDLVAYHGIIRWDGTRGLWEPGPGGIISITRDPRESGASRALFMTHEGLHGLYYMNQRLVEQAEAEWYNLSQDVRTYLKRYFDRLQYDTNDDFLVKNEFQAYMLQQSLQELRWVFGTRYRDRLISSFPQEREFFMRVAPIAANEFFDAAFRLQSLLFAEYGFLGGNLHSLRLLD
jgi:hypothetical protein